VTFWNKGKIVTTFYFIRLDCGALKPKTGEMYGCIRVNTCKIAKGDLKLIYKILPISLSAFNWAGL